MNGDSFLVGSPTFTKRHQTVLMTTHRSRNTGHTIFNIGEVTQVTNTTGVMRYRIASPQSVMEPTVASERDQYGVTSACDFQIEKTRAVQECLEQVPVSLWELRELALSKGGLMNGMLPSRAVISIILFSSSPFSTHRRNSEEGSLAPFSRIAKHRARNGTNIKKCQRPCQTGTETYYVMTQVVLFSTSTINNSQTKFAKTSWAVFLAFILTTTHERTNHKICCMY